VLFAVAVTVAVAACYSAFWWCLSIFTAFDIDMQQLVTNYYNLVAQQSANEEIVIFTVGQKTRCISVALRSYSICIIVLRLLTGCYVVDDMLQLQWMKGLKLWISASRQCCPRPVSMSLKPRVKQCALPVQVDSFMSACLPEVNSKVTSVKWSEVFDFVVVYVVNVL